MEIKAVAAYKQKEILKPFAYNAPNLAPNEVEIKITHCGICHSDIHLIDNDWGISKYPIVPGHEVVGIVSNLGSNVKHLKKGERAGVGWQSGSCHHCEYCIAGDENLCRENQATCVGHHGGFADSLIVDSGFAFKIPDELTSENAAPLLCAGITVYSPLRLFNILPKHRVGVIGIGGLGHLAVQFAAKMGCEVTAFSTSKDKEAEARKFGATKFINSKSAVELKSVVSYYDIILSTVTAPLDWNTYISLLRPKGRLNFLGATVGGFTLHPSILIGGQKSISGSNTGGSVLINEMLEFAARHNIVAQTEVLPFDEVNRAIEKVRNNTARYRMVLEMD